MASTGIVISERYLEHDTGPHHPERAARLRAIHDRLEQTSLRLRCEMISPTAIELDLVERVHPPEYISRFRHACENLAAYIDTPECPVSKPTFEIARLAAGGMIDAVDAVMAGRITNAFCAVRPPGHHAERRQAMGFCYFNNIAIGAEYVRARHGIQRVAIVDFDVHHGNGTQHHFDCDPNVLFCSVHQDPRTLYPGTGFDWETGRGEGEGTTLNVPLSPGSGDEEHRWAFQERIIPAVRAFEPGFLLVSAGFDGHHRDPLANLMVTTEGYAWMSRQLVELAAELCGGRLVSTLEGGYDLQALADSVQAHVEALLVYGVSQHRKRT